MRLIQVGLGHFGRSWATLVQAGDTAHLAAIVDPSPDARAWAQAALGLVPACCFASLPDALERVECESVLIVTPPETHAALAILALRAGRHVLVEKPLATTWPDAVHAVTVAAEVGRTLMVSQNYRFRPGARTVQRLVRDGVIGDLLSVRLTFRRDTRALFPTGDFRYCMRHPLLLDMAIHHVDLIRAITGQNIARVAALSWPAPDSPYQHHPTAAALMTLSGNTPALYDGDWAARDGETPWDGHWELLGTAGRLVWHGGSSGGIRLSRWGAPPEDVPSVPLPAEDRAGVLHAFATAIQDGTEPETSGFDNLNSVGSIFACVEAADSGETVAVPSAGQAHAERAGAEPA